MSTNTERNNQLADDFMDGKTVKELSEIYGIGQRMILRILQTKGLRAKNRKMQIPLKDRQRPKSKLHKAIGDKIYDFYFIKKNMNRAAAAEALGVSAKALKGIETGYSQLSLTDLQTIARFMDTTIGELTSGD